MPFDRFNVCRAYWLLASNYHTGQRCPLYAVLSTLSRLRYCPSSSDCEWPARDDDTGIRDALADAIRRWRRGDIRHR